MKIARSDFRGTVLASIKDSGDDVAVHRHVTILHKLSAAPMTIVNGPRPNGSTCLTLALATGANSCVMCNSPSAGACTAILEPMNVNRDVIPVPTTGALLAAATCKAQRRRVAQFEGGLTTPCSRLGRRVRRTVGMIPVGFQFEGTSLRRLGPRPIALLPQGGDRKLAWPPATPTSRSPWRTTPSALRRRRGSARPRQRPALHAAWRQFVHASQRGPLAGLVTLPTRAMPLHMPRPALPNMVSQTRQSSRGDD